MDRDVMRRHLDEAERHVAEGNRHLCEQEARTAALDRDGHDTTEARRLLRNFRATQIQHIAHRNHILEQLKR